MARLCNHLDLMFEWRSCIFCPEWALSSLRHQDGGIMVARRRHEKLMTHKTLSTWSSSAHSLSMRNIRRTKGVFIQIVGCLQGLGYRTGTVRDQACVLYRLP